MIDAKVINIYFADGGSCLKLTVLSRENNLLTVETVKGKKYEVNLNSSNFDFMTEYDEKDLPTFEDLEDAEDAYEMVDLHSWEEE